MVESHQRNKQSKRWLRGHFDTGGSLPVRTPLLSTVCTLWSGPSCIVSISYMWKIWAAAQKRTNTLTGHSVSRGRAPRTSTASTLRFAKTISMGWSMGRHIVQWLRGSSRGSPPCRTLVFLCSPATSWNLPRVTIIARFLIADSKLLTAIVNKTWTWICLDVSHLDLSLRRPLRIWKSADRFVCKTAQIFWWERDAQCCQNGAQMAQESWKKSRAEPFTCLGSSLRNLASVLPLCGLLSKRCGHDMLMTSRKIHDFELERCN